MTITREQFVTAVGFEPQDDDLERCNCEETHIGHSACGWCGTHNRPRFVCPSGCWHKAKAAS